MAHLIDNLETLDLKTAHMIYCEKYGTPWHKGGVPVADLLSVDKAKELAPTIFAPTTAQPLTAKILGPDGKPASIPTGYKALLQQHHQKDTDYAKRVVVGVQTDSYEVLDFAPALESVIGKEEIIDTAFIMKGGAQWCAALRIGESFSVMGKDDQVDLLLTLHSGHDGTALWAFITAIRAVCANTINFGKQSATKIVKKRHTKSIHQQVINLRSELGIVQKEAHEFAAFCNAMAGKQLNSQQIRYIFDEVFPKRGRPTEPVKPVLTGDESADFKANLRYREEVELFKMAMAKYGDGRSEASERLDTLIETQPGADMSRGTLWSAVNAITYYLDHEHIPTIRGDKSDAAIFDARLASNIYGYSQDKKDQTLALARKILA